ncbi:MAG TPA: hypothetical protein DEP84_24285, partial [Chloroflexi bacterium]|nr:hypothetical protein [Chloroflexota bacterium]
TGQPLSLATDTTNLTGPPVTCPVAAIARGRAVPPVWQVSDRTSVMLACAAYQARDVVACLGRTASGCHLVFWRCINPTNLLLAM